MTHQRPQRRYRLDFRQLVLGDRPRSVLDVGCGSGSLLRWFSKGGIAVEGVESNGTLVGKLRGDGYVAHHARAEALPFPDESFDCVVSEFCAHHFEDLARAIAESMRVARRSVWLLDQWYDPGLASQRRTLRWDSWFKRIDRRLGKIHNEVLSVADFLAAMPDVPRDRLEFQHWLRLAPVELEWFDEESAEHLALATADEVAELAEIRVDAISEGMTEDGATVVRVDVTQSMSRSAPQ